MEIKICEYCHKERSIDTFILNTKKQTRGNQCYFCRKESRNKINKQVRSYQPKKIKIKPESKDCTICKMNKTQELFRLKPTPSDPEWRTNQCNDCMNTLIRERQRKNDTHKRRYDAMSEEERKAYIKKKSEQNQIRMKTKPEVLAKKKEYDKSDKGIYNRYRGDCNRRTRLTRGITMDLTFEQFSEIINKSCFYCNTENSRGVDRIDSSKSYQTDNCNPCCKTCNQMKNDLSHVEFLSHISKIQKNLN
jgi:translation initiation factor IF-1